MEDHFHCGCFLKVHVCPRCLGIAGAELDRLMVVRKAQLFLGPVLAPIDREGREASEDGDGVL